MLVKLRNNIVKLENQELLSYKKTFILTEKEFILHLIY